jgi:hypothetical protein
MKESGFRYVDQSPSRCWTGRRTTKTKSCHDSQKLKMAGEWWSELCAADAFAFVGDIVNHDVVAYLVRRRVKNPAGVEA